MKRILVVLATLIWGAGAMSQVVPEWYRGELKKSGSVLSVRGEKLDRETTLALLEQVGGQEMAASWEKDRRERNWGIGLTAGGYTVAAAGLAVGGTYFLAGVVGTIFVAIGGQKAVDKLWADIGSKAAVGGAVFLTGFAAGTTGVVLLSTGNSRMRKKARLCDEAGAEPVPSAQLSFGQAPSGAGLMLRF